MTSLLLPRITRAFNRSGAARPVTLEIFKAFERDWHTIFFINLSLLEFQVAYLAILCLFSVTDSYEWFCMGNLYKNIQLMREFHKAPFLVLHFFYYT